MTHLAGNNVRRVSSWVKIGVHEGVDGTNGEQLAAAEDRGPSDEITPARIAFPDCVAYFGGGGGSGGGAGIFCGLSVGGALESADGAGPREHPIVAAMNITTNKKPTALPIQFSCTRGGNGKLCKPAPDERS